MLYTITLLLLLLSCLLTMHYAVFPLLSRRRTPLTFPQGAVLPRVSILKPVKSIDDALETNLESFYTLDYPDYEIIFGVKTLQDPSIPYLEAARDRHPGIPTRIVETGDEQVMNPKIDILSKTAPRASGSLYWVSDSNTRVAPGTLRDLVHAYVTRGAKIVFSPIRGTGSRSLGSIMNNAYINFFVSGNVIASWRYFRKPIIVGKSMLIEKDALEKLGGFPRFGVYLAEDYMMGEIYRENGVFVATNFTWVTNFSSTMTVGAFCSRAARWSRLRFHIAFFFYLLEIFTNPFGIALLSLLWLGAAALPLVALAAAVKIACEYVNFFAVNTGDRRSWRVVLAYPPVVLFRDILLLGVYFIPFFSRSVNWRGHKIRIGPKSRIQ